MKLYLSCSLDVFIMSMRKFLYGTDYLFRESITDDVEFLIYEYLIGARRFTWSIVTIEVEDTLEVSIVYSGVDGLLFTEKYREKKYKNILAHFKKDGIQFELGN